MKSLWFSCLIFLSVSALADFPVTIEHKYGSITLEEVPERVVSVGFTEQDDLIALGVMPIAVRPWSWPIENAIWPWAEQAAESINSTKRPSLLGRGDLDMEAIAAHEPDLIVAIYSGITREEYDRLSLIAPVLAQPGEYADYTTPWQVQTRLIGQALGRSEAAEELIEQTEERFAQTREQYPQFEGKTFAPAFYSNGQPGVFANGESRSHFFTKLGFVAPEIYDREAGDSFYVYFSPERIDLLDTDLLVWYWGSSPEEMLQEPGLGRLLDTLAAHREGREIIMPEFLRYALSFSTPLSLSYVLDELTPLVAERIQ